MSEIVECRVDQCYTIMNSNHTKSESANEILFKRTSICLRISNLYPNFLCKVSRYMDLYVTKYNMARWVFIIKVMKLIHILNILKYIYIITYFCIRHFTCFLFIVIRFVYHIILVVVYVSIKLCKCLYIWCYIYT